MPTSFRLAAKQKWNASTDLAKSPTKPNPQTRAMHQIPLTNLSPAEPILMVTPTLWAIYHEHVKPTSN